MHTIRKLFGVFAALVLLWSTTLAQTQLPQPQGMVSDFAGKLSPSTREQLETLVRNFRDRSGVEIAIVTINFDDMRGHPIEDYALQLGRQWGVGRGSQGRGLLLLVAIKPADAQGGYTGGTRLEVSRHLEGDVPDSLAGELIRRMRDNFKAGRFDQALTDGTQTMLATLAQKLGISMEGIDQRQAVRTASRQSRSGRRGGISPFLIVVGIFIVLAIIRSIGGGGGRGGRRRRRNWGSGMDWVILPMILNGLGRDRGDSGWGSFGDGGGDSGWSGGDFGGFGGGGDFGGGGASDSW